MNTLAHAVTLFTDEGASITGPIAPGPTLYEWELLVRERARPEAEADSETARTLAAIPAEHRAAFDETPPRAGLAEDYRDELAALRPESHPSRAMYGEYLAWCFDRAAASLPSGAALVRHRASAVAIDGRRLELDDGTGIEADAIVLATGWMPRAETAEERRIAAALAENPELVWVRPESPADQRFEAVPAGEPVIVRGLGMGFFDAAALLTVERGGRFVEDPAAAGGLRYEPSGREPILHVTSRRGVPFRSKSLYRSLPPRAAQRTLRGVDWSTRPRPINFDAEVWPLIVIDAHLDYYETLHRTRPEAFAAPLRTVLDAIRGSEGSLTAIEAALAPLVPAAADRFDLEGELVPVRERFGSPADFDRWIRRRMSDDLAEAELGRNSALKAGLWSISSARGVAGAIGTLGGFDAESRTNGFATLYAVGGMVGSGPPAFRTRELLALQSAGLVHFIGPAGELTAGPTGFTAASPLVEGSEVSARALVDAWVHGHRVSESADPLVRSLVEAGRARPFAVPGRAGGRLETGGFDVDGATGRLIGADGAPDPLVHVVGIPLDETLHETIISPIPGSDPPMLRETDRTARSLLGLALPEPRGEAVPAPRHHEEAPCA